MGAFPHGDLGQASLIDGGKRSLANECPCRRSYNERHQGRTSFIVAVYIDEPHLEQLVSTCQKLAWENLLVLLSLRSVSSENALVG